MRIAFLITPNMLATSLTNAFEIFFAANQTVKLAKVTPPSLVNDQDTSKSTTRPAELIKVSPLASRTTLASGLSLLADQGLTEDVFDMVYLPALWRNPRPTIKRYPEIVKWVRRQYENGAIINSTGTGVCFLAESGLLDKRPATTHWHYFDQFAKDYPEVELKRQHFITTSGKIYCAASVNALTDLTLHHIHRYFGAEVSEHLSRHFSTEVRQPFDSLSFNAEENTNHPDEDILQAQLWMQNNLNKSSVSISGLSKLFGMSQRNFSRRFKMATNMTPIQYLQSRRLEAAKELLRASNLSIKEIAYRVGYIDVSYFSKLFKQSASITPQKYRSSVRAKLFSSS